MREGNDVDEREDKMKALANDILEQCQKQGLTFSETRTLLMIMGQRVDEGRDRAMEEAGGCKLSFRPF